MQWHRSRAGRKSAGDPGECRSQLLRRQQLQSLYERSGQAAPGGRGRGARTGGGPVGAPWGPPPPAAQPPAPVPHHTLLHYTRCTVLVQTVGERLDVPKAARCSPGCCSARAGRSHAAAHLCKQQRRDGRQAARRVFTPTNTNSGASSTAAVLRTHVCCICGGAWAIVCRERRGDDWGERLEQLQAPRQRGGVLQRRYDGLKRFGSAAPA